MEKITHVIEAQRLVKRFDGKPPVAAVDDISLGVAKGTLTALVGPDGAGKTTFMRMAAGLLTPSSGRLTVLGVDAAAHPQKIQDQISYMPQRFGLYEDLSVMENLQLYADLTGVPSQTRPDTFGHLLKMTDLEKFTTRPAGKLSGGMKQKLGLACTLVRTPTLLLLDEPSVGVDPLSRRDLWQIIETLVAKRNLSVLVSTAYMDEAERCAQVVVMDHGKMLAMGSVDTLLECAAGCTFAAAPPQGRRARQFQADLLAQPGAIADAVPKGDVVRFIRTRDHRDEKIFLPVSLTGQAEAVPREADLEDAFMLILHQARKAAPKAGGPVADQAPDSGPALGRPIIKQKTSDGPVIKVENLVRTFGDFTAVASTSFDVRHGEIFGLLGPNGAGKTTTFRMLCGLLPASGGHLEVAGLNLRTARAKARACIGYVSQKFALYGNLTVRENLEFFGGAYGLAGSRLRKRIADSLDQFSLEASAKSCDLPGGYKQRLAMAAALLHEPEILFLDEPTSGIDPLARRTFWVTIGKLADSGVTVIVTTHFMEEAEYCDRIVIQDAGKMIALGTPKQVRQQAGEGFASDMNQAFIAIVESGRAMAAAAGKGLS